MLNTINYTLFLEEAGLDLVIAAVLENAEAVQGGGQGLATAKLRSAAVPAAAVKLAAAAANASPALTRKRKLILCYSFMKVSFWPLFFF